MYHIFSFKSLKKSLYKPLLDQANCMRRTPLMADPGFIHILDSIILLSVICNFLQWNPLWLPITLHAENKIFINLHCDYQRIKGNVRFLGRGIYNRIHLVAMPLYIRSQAKYSEFITVLIFLHIITISKHYFHLLLFILNFNVLSCLLPFSNLFITIHNIK